MFVLIISIDSTILNAITVSKLFDLDSGVSTWRNG